MERERDCQKKLAAGHKMEWNVNALSEYCWNSHWVGHGKSVFT